MGGGGKKKSKKKKSKVQQAAAKRHANFKKTGVQTHGGTRKSYSKSEARKIQKAGLSFSKVTGGAANPLNRAPSTAGVKVGEMKPEFATSLTGTDYSKFAAPNINYNYSERSPSDVSFSDAVRGGARFNEAGRNELTGGTNTAFLNFNKIKESPANTPLGDGMINESLNQMQQNLKQKYDLMRDSGIMSDDDYNKNMKRLMGDKFKDQSSLNNTGTLTATHDNRLFKSVPATGPAADTPASKDFIDGSLQRNITPSSPGNIYGIKLASNDLSNLGISTAGGSEAGFDRDSFNRAMEGNYDPESSGGLNIGSSAFGLDSETSSRIGRALAAGPSPRMLSEGGDLQMSDMFNADTPGATLTQGINTLKNRIPILNRLPDMKMNSVAEEAQRQYLGYNPNLPSNVLKQQNKRGGSGSGFVAAPTVFNQALPQQQVVPSASTTPTTQTGVDPNRLLQIQQQAYQQAYNPMSIGGFNPQFRFASRTPRIDNSTYFNYR